MLSTDRAAQFNERGVCVHVLYTEEVAAGYSYNLEFAVKLTPCMSRLHIAHMHTVRTRNLHQASPLLAQHEHEHEHEHEHGPSMCRLHIAHAYS